MATSCGLWCHWLLCYGLYGIWLLHPMGWILLCHCHQWATCGQSLMISIRQVCEAWSCPWRQVWQLSRDRPLVILAPCVIRGSKAPTYRKCDPRSANILCDFQAALSLQIHGGCILLKLKASENLKVLFRVKDKPLAGKVYFKTTPNKGLLITHIKNF